MADQTQDDHPSFAGWETVENDVVPFTAYEVDQENPTMRRLFVRKAGEKWVVYYWFHAGERLADHEWTVRGYRFLDLLRGAPFKPTIIVTAYVPVAVSWERADERAADFLRSVGRHVRDAVMAELPTTS